MRVFGCLLLLSFGSFLTGCAVMEQAGPAATAGVALQGKVHGGQQPVYQSHVYLLAATVSGTGTAGYGLGSTSLLTGTGHSDAVGGYVLTAADGSFSLDTVNGSTTTYDYTCPANNPEVYLYALGGNTGSGTNAAAGFLAALGPCASLSSNTYTYINEVTTVAAAYALAGFATDAAHVSIPQYQPGATGATGPTGSTGSTGSVGAADTLAQTGLTNAFLNATQLVDSTTGVANTATPATGSNGTPDTAMVNTLANILASCINSNGATTGPTNATNCYTLFNNALSGGATGTVPTDTATAAINIAHHPYVSAAVMTNLYGLQAAGGAPFVGLSSQPNDFTVGIKYTGGGLNNPYGISIDVNGNVWVVNTSGNNVTEFSSMGVPATGTPFGGSMDVPYQLAFDMSGNAWVGNTGEQSVTELSSSGTGGTLVNGGQSAATRPISIDASGNVWGGTYSLFVITSGGTTGNKYTAGVDTSDASRATAIDAAGYIWSASFGTGFSILKTSTGAAFSGSPYTYTNGLSRIEGVAIDSSGNAWFSGGSDSNNNPFLLKVAGRGGSQTTYSGGGMVEPFGIAIDGSENVWVADEDEYVVEFSNAGAPLTPSTGYKGGQNLKTHNVAIDGSGDVWLSNQANSVSVLIGAATPVVTPIVQGLVSPYTPGSKP